MTPFRWKNCYADIASAKHDLTIRSFLQDVIMPAIKALEARIDELGRSEEPAACFEHFDMEEVLSETKLAFCLAIQSVWERQLRGYLRSCADELLPGEGISTKVEKANWQGLCALFKELRGIGLDAFPSFAELDLLHHVGNACRHGDGGSATELGQRCPDWWPVHTPLPPEFGVSLPQRMVASMTVPLDRIEGFVAAIARFWEDATYIYNESINRKADGLEQRLARERIERDWCPKAEDHA